jgi:hypothetical protein
LFRVIDKAGGEGEGVGDGRPVVHGVVAELGGVAALVSS